MGNTSGSWAGLQQSIDLNLQDLVQDDFSGLILKSDYRGEVPITALTGMVKDIPIDFPSYMWATEAPNMVMLQVNGALGSTDTVITVDGTDPSSSSPFAYWGAATNLSVGTLLTVSSALTTGVAVTHEVIQVTEILSATQFRCRRGVSGSTPASIADNATIVPMGTAWAEGSGSPSGVYQHPYTQTNYTQIFKEAAVLTKTAMASTGGQRVKSDPRAVQQASAARRQAQGIERSFLFGRKNQVVQDGRVLRTTGGLLEFMRAENITTFSAPVGYNDLVNALEPLFDYVPEGSNETRIAFCGNGVLIELGKIIAGQGQVQFGEVVERFGISFKDLILPYGTISFKAHPLLTQDPIHRYSAFVLDFNVVKKRTLRPMKLMTDVQAADEDLVKDLWIGEFGWQIQHAATTCGYLGNILAS